MRDPISPDAITAEWLREHAPAVHAELLAAERSDGGEPEAIAAAERERIAAIVDAGRGLGLERLVEDMIADRTPLPQARRRLLDAARGMNTSYLAMLRDHEASMRAPQPGFGSDSNGAHTAKDAVTLARRVGMVR